jgi:serine protease Do
MVTTPSGLGSGFILTPDGYVVTNDHVVQGETKIAVVLFEKKDGVLEKRKIEKVKLVATDPHQDLALLKMEDVKDLPIVYLGDSDGLRVGQTVYAIGNPHGLDRTVSEGIVSTLNRIMDGRPHIQTTTAVNPGNSGGPLFDLHGRVIGVVDLKLIFSEGLNFAIPVNRLKRFLQDREAYAYDKDNPNTGYRYLPPPPKGEPKARQ